MYLLLLHFFIKRTLGSVRDKQVGFITFLFDVLRMAYGVNLWLTRLWGDDVSIIWHRLSLIFLSEVGRLSSDLFHCMAFSVSMCIEARLCTSANVAARVLIRDSLNKFVVVL